MPTKKASIGTLLKRQPPGGGALVTVAGVDNLQGPAMSTDILDVTALDSTGWTEEVTPGVIRPGEITADLHFMPDDAVQGTAGLIADQSARAVRQFSITYPSDTPKTVSFSAFVIQVSPKANTKNPLAATLRMRVTGVPSWA